MRGSFTLFLLTVFLYSSFSFLGLQQGTGLYGQSLELEGAPSGPVTGYYDDGKKLVAKVRVKNVSSQDREVIVARKVIDEVQGSENQFCWSTSCYIPSIDTSPDIQTITANGGVDSTFAGYYHPKDNPGVTTIQYCFFTKADSSDSICDVVRYDASSSTSIEENSEDRPSFSFSPNPAVDDLNVRFPEVGRGRIQLHSILGELVLEKEVSGERELVLDVSGLDNGVHFLRYEGKNGGTMTERVLIGR